MAEPKHARPRQEPPMISPSADRRHLSALASALERYGVRSRIVEGRAPFLRAGNPESDYAVEEVRCECRAYEYAFVTSFGVCLGSSADIGRAAERTARLLGVAAS
ncbi:hypothetical protein [Allosalinactinospora lopnorensis]|uniref:hypothetical protein n=1 Tax=Allosalinactinospora lopnorensis TaxID=1352348 RepID=UPI000623CF86|nr:hypothetical protein [Allosalinactinospora lopnorensis]